MANRHVRRMLQKTTLLKALWLVVGAMLVLFVVSAFSEMNQTLSKEAQQYQQDGPDAMRGGLSTAYAASKLLFLVGGISGLVGGILVSMSRRRGLAAIAVAGPMIALAAYLNAPQYDYPSVEPINSQILWCATAAAWAAAVALAWVSGTSTSPPATTNESDAP